MEKVGFPLSAKMRGAKVRVLHGALASLGVAVAESERGRQYFGASTKAAVAEFQKMHGLEATGAVDERTANALNVAVEKLEAAGPAEGRRFVVSGRVLRDDGSPVEGVAVRAFDKALRVEKNIGEARTDAEGVYKIFYRPEEFSRRAKGQADLIVRAYDPTASKVVAESPIIVGAGPAETVDLTVPGDVYRGPSEYERVWSAVEPALRTAEGAPVKPGDVDEEDMTYLAAKTGVATSQLAVLILADRLADKTGLDRGVLYGLGSQGLPLVADSLNAYGPAGVYEAFDKAEAANVLPPDIVSRMDEIKAALFPAFRKAAVAELLRPSEGEKPSELGGLLGVAGLADDQKESILLAYEARPPGEPLEKFWEAQRAVLGAKRVEGVQRTLQLGLLTGNHVPLVAELKSLLDARKAPLRKLADIPESEWEGLVNKTGAPEDLPGGEPDETETTRRARYVTMLRDQLEEAFPTPFLLARAKEDFRASSTGEGSLFGEDTEAVIKLLETAADGGEDGGLELRDTKLSRFVAEHPDVFERAGIAAEDDRIRIQKHALSFERVFRVAPALSRYPVIRVLLERGYDSAVRIAGVGKWAFISRLTQPGPSPSNTRTLSYLQAGEVHAKAGERFATALVLLCKTHASVAGLGTVPLPASEYWKELLSDLLDPTDKSLAATYETLFGSADYCKVPHCGSVYGPAAYLADLLRFLDQYRVREGQTLLEKLSEVRPDIKEIELSCDNTNKLLPYIDLVNEVLENAVSKGAHGDWPQTTGRPEDLALQPEHLRAGAYDTLKGPRYPFALPFDLWSEEARAYLDLAGVTLSQVLEAFYVPSAPTETAWPLSALEDPLLAAAYLGITPAELDILDEASNFSVSDLWGERDNLKCVKEILILTGLSFEDLVQIIATRSLQGKAEADKPIRIEFEPADDRATCDTGKAHVLNFTDEAQTFLHRFIRLRSRLGWTTHELDHALQVFGASQLGGNVVVSEAVVARLAFVHRLSGELRVPVIEMLAWWGNIDTRAPAEGAPSLYERLFLSKGVVSTIPPDHGANPFQLDEQGNELACTESLIESNAAGVIAGLGLTAGELEELLVALPESDKNLNLENLSALFRYVSLSRALKLSIREFVALRWLLVPTFDRNRPANLWRAREAVRIIRACKLTTSQLSYLLRHVDDPNAKLAPDAERVQDLLTEIGAAVQQARKDNFIDVLPESEIPTKEDVDELVKLDPRGELLLERLGQRLTPDDLERVQKFIAKVPEPGESNAALAEDFDDVIAPLLPLDKSYEIKNQLVEYNENLPDALHRSAFLLPWVLWRDYRAAAERLVVDRLAAALELETAICEALLRKYVTRPNPSDTTEQLPALDIFRSTELDEDFRTSTFVLLHKIASLLRHLGAKADELNWIMVTGPSLDTLDLNALPIDETTAADMTEDELRLRFERCLSLLYAFELRNRLFGGMLFDLFEAAAEIWENRDPSTAEPEVETEFLKELTRRIGWSWNDLNDVIGELGIRSAKYWRDCSNLRQLDTVFKVLRLLGISAKQAFDWIGPDGTFNSQEPKAREVRLAMRARYDENGWRQVARPIRDRLRERQRDALAAYLLKDAGKSGANFNDIDDLYEHYLVDVQMTPAMITSRIKQAISSVQLFVQRVLMNLDEDVQLAPGGTEEGQPDIFRQQFNEMSRRWQWMKSYRLWEANRKVFLYPENWVEPGLRDGKSPFFRDLENDILQSDLDAESAEKAFRRYLEQLDAVARLEICGLCEEEVDDEEVLYVFGRTQAVPHVYYFRRRVRGAWAPWERIDLDIEGDHLIPVVWRRRLYLFWPIFTDVTEKESTDSNRPVSVTTYYEIQLAWSVFEDGRWSAKKTTRKASREAQKARLCISWLMKKDTATQKGYDPEDIFFFAAKENRNYIIQVYWKTVEVNSFSGLILLAVFKIEVPSKFISELQDYGYPQVSEKFLIGGFRGKRIYQVVREVGPILSLGEEVFIDDLPSEMETITLLTLTKQPLTIIYAQARKGFGFQYPFFVADNARTFFVELVDVPVEGYYFKKPDKVPVTKKPWKGKTQKEKKPIYKKAGYNKYGPPSVSRAGYPFITRKYRFCTYYHPNAGLLMSQLSGGGVDALLDPPESWDPDTEGLRRQLKVTDGFFQIPESGESSEAEYVANPGVVTGPVPVEDFDFRAAGAYSIYNWEVFFHAPFLIATALSANGRYEEAQKWFHYIFNPTERLDEVSERWLQLPAARFWKIKPFFELFSEPGLSTSPIQELMTFLSPVNADEPPEIRREIKQLIANWRDDPFNPHLIARSRLAAYAKAVFIKYLDNLIAWADDLFRRYTIETINEAAQLYVLAARLLGVRPQQVTREEAEPRTYAELATSPSGMDEFGNALVTLETQLSETGLPEGNADGVVNFAGSFLYFGIPPNEKLLNYWAVVADRLFKIRHCLNIEGIAQELPLFEPPIEPGLLVRARAAGIDIGAVLRDVQSPVPYQRFPVLAQKASELCAEVKALGNALLSALEKRDAEELGLMRARHEGYVLDAVRQVKVDQLKETEYAYAGLERARELAEIRRDFYEQRCQSGRSPKEKAQLDQLKLALVTSTIGQFLEMTASTAAQTPETTGGATCMGGNITATYGGHNLSQALHMFAQYSSMIASINSQGANISGIEAGLDRRDEEWDHQLALSKKEIEQYDQQILAAEIRKSIAERDLENHDLQIENSNETEDFLRGKFTNQELYGWQINQIRSIYRQAYELAYDLSKRAERAWQYEMGDFGRRNAFIHFENWEGTRQGLLAGEKLQLDLKRMETAYLESQRRDYEITKHVSLALINPLALLELKKTGACIVELNEELFDFDYPGHYLRRIKSVAVSIPCVTGPYTGVHCTLTLTKSSVRFDNKLSEVGKYARNDNGDERFTDNLGVIQSIVTSNAQNDGGLFETNLRDELRLPFEGMGAISTLDIKIPEQLRQFDYDTISDVILHIRYTARDGGEALKRAATDELISKLENGNGREFIQLFSARHQFGDSWNRFLNPFEGEVNQTLTFELEQGLFPFFFQKHTLKITGVELCLDIKDISTYTESVSLFVLPPGDDEGREIKLEITDDEFGGLPHGPCSFDSNGFNVGAWSIQFREVDDREAEGVVIDVAGHKRIDPEAVNDLLIVLRYRVEK